jgi:hypothetical protein
MRMERAEGEAMRVERESEAECVAQEQVIDSICCMLCIFSSGCLASYRNTHCLK